MPANADSGKTFVLAVIVVTLLMDLTVIFLTTVLTDSGDLGIQLIRLSITVGLAALLYRGAGWARWTFSVLFGVAGLSFLLLVFILPVSITSLSGIFIALIGLVCLGLGAVLTFNPSVRLFFERKQLERQNAKRGHAQG